MGFREIEEFLPPFTEPLAKDPTAADGNPALNDLQAVTGRIFPRIEKTEDPLHPVGTVHHHQCHRGG